MIRNFTIDTSVSNMNTLLSMLPSRTKILSALHLPKDGLFNIIVPSRNLASTIILYLMLHNINSK